MKKEKILSDLKELINDSENFIKDKTLLNSLTIEYHKGRISSLRESLQKIELLDTSDVFENMKSLEIVFCKVLNVEHILKNPKKEASLENPTKAYKLTIDTGSDYRDVVTNIVDSFQPDQLKNQILSFLLNLPESNIRGVISKGMIIIATNKEGKLELIKGESIGSKLF